MRLNCQVIGYTTRRENTMPAIKIPKAELFSGIPPGSWVAISRNQERVLATGRTLEAALRRARDQGEKKPFIIRVPAKPTALIL